LASRLALQWVPPGGSSCSVIRTTRSTVLSGKGGLPGGRVASCNSPSTPSATNRASQRRTVGSDLPTARATRVEPNPSPANSTIRAR
jgi:hypothetical protein